MAKASSGYPLRGITDGSENCECHQCIKDFHLGESMGDLGFVPLSSSKMILCGICGNKRCPKASNHRFSYTNSNAPGQDGSIYK